MDAVGIAANAGSARRTAVQLALATVVWNVVEGVAAVGFGLAEESVALLGFGLDSWVEVASAVVVLWRLRAEVADGTPMAVTRERRATRIIGGLLCTLAGAAAVGAVLQLALQASPGTTLPGLVISGISLAIMGALWRAKLRVARALDSRTLFADAACSRGCLELSAVLFAGSLLSLVAPSLWWADAAAAIGLSVLIGREGIQTIRAAQQPTFTGGCGCGSDHP